MCGIAGLVNTPGKNVETMVDRLHHRGPDDHGTWLSPDGRVQLGHTRLAVLDPSPAGHQPFVDKAGSVALVYNGECYNFPDLKRSLEDDGEALRTSCDTEVILKLYLRHGKNCFKMIDGMFAIGIYDGRNGDVILARDRIGKKPLYWFQKGDSFGFASEIKALEPVFPGGTQISPEAVLSYLQFDYVPTPSSIYQDVYKLLPGHVLTLRGKSATIEPFWSVDPERRFDGTYEDALNVLDTRLNHAVQKRLLSDVPIGVFLSGGLDSTAVAAYAAKHQSRLETFSIAFEDPTYDESGFARQAADYLGTRHHEWTVGAGDLIDTLTHVPDWVDEPLGDSSIIPTYLLAHHTRQHVTVALGGDGGDELFSGYPTFKAEQMAKFLSFIPSPLWGTLRKTFNAFARPSGNYLSSHFVGDRFLAGMGVKKANRHQRWLGSFTKESALALMDPGLRENLICQPAYRELEGWSEHAGRWPDRNGLLYEYLRTYLMDEVLVKVDRATMATSLEARSPLLDTDLVEFAFSLPYGWKQKRGGVKQIFKNLMRGRIPDEIIDRPKKGFGMPVAQWFRDELKDWTRETLTALDGVGIQSAKAIELHDAHLAHRGDYRKELWNLVSLSHFIKTQSERHDTHRYARTA